MMQEALNELVKEYGGEIMEFHSANYGLRAMEPLQSGQCLALSLLSISKKSGTTLFGKESLLNQYFSLPNDARIDESNLTAHCCKIMTQQTSLLQYYHNIESAYDRSVLWLKGLAPSYGLAYNHHEESGGNKKSGLKGGLIARYILSNQGRYIIGMSGKVSHALSAVNAGTNVYLFDPNFGMMNIPEKQFTDFCLDFFYEMNHSKTYQYENSLMIRFGM